MFAILFSTFCLTDAFVPILSQFIDDVSIGRHSEPFNKSLKDYSSGNARTFNVFDHNSWSWNSVVRQIREGFGQNDAISGGYSYHQQPQAYQMQYQQPQQENQHVKTVILTKHVPQPYKIETERRIPHYVKVPVEKPYPVYIEKPYTVAIEKPFKYPVKVFIPQPYTVDKEVPIPVNIPVEKPTPYIVPKPYPVYKEKIVKYAVENPVYYPVKVPFDRPHPVHVPVEKKVPYTIESKVNYPVYVPQDRPVPFPIEKPFPITYEKEVPYPVEKPIPVPVAIPVRVPVQVPVPFPIIKHEPIFIPVHEHSQDQDYHQQNNVQTFDLPTFANPTSTTNSVAPVENNLASNALDAVQFVNQFSQSSAAPPSSVSDNSFDGSVNVAQSVLAPTTTVDEEDDEESTVTELPSTSTSQSANLTSV